MKFTYDTSKNQFIIDNENMMLKTYSEIISSCSPLFEQYGCTLEIKLFWLDYLTEKQSEHRLPFRNGYSCYVYCEVQKGGKEVCIKSDDGEADYYSLSASWLISEMERNFFKTKVSLYSNTEYIKKDKKEWLQLLSEEI